jgi:putative FmdB family regulatory protein
MPVYDYKCTACQAKEEHILLPGDEAPTACNSCGGALKRSFSGGRVKINLEGWGFTKTDSLVSQDRPPKNWKMLKERAERIADE